MMKTIAAGIWVVVVVLGSAYGAATWKQASDQHAAEEKPATPMETVKVKAVIVPILGDGTVQHYIRAQVAFTIESRPSKPFPLRPSHSSWTKLSAPSLLPAVIALPRKGRRSSIGL